MIELSPSNVPNSFVSTMKECGDVIKKNKALIISITAIGLGAIATGVALALAAPIGLALIPIAVGVAIASVSIIAKLWSGIDRAQTEKIRWKIRKYEGQITQLHRKMGERLKTDEDCVVKLYQMLKSDTILDSNDDRFNHKYLKEIRKIYKGFLKELRAALEENPDNENLHTICEILFTEIDLSEEWYETLDAFDEIGAEKLKQNVNDVDPNCPGNHPFVKRINTLRNRLKAVPESYKEPRINKWASSAKGHLNKGFDPYKQGNPVHVLYHLKVGGKVVKVLGMGSPTIEPFNGQAELLLEFIGFGRSYKRQGKKHLFILNQNLIPLNNGDETVRGNLILNSQERKDLEGAIYVIALSKNSPFYYQEGDYAKEQISAYDFKQQLYDQVLNGKHEETGCCIPPRIRREITNFDEKERAIREEIHRILFDGRETLSLEERKKFIEAYYDELTKMIMKELGVDSINISCKDGIDRGAGSNAQLAANCEIVHKDLIDEIDQKLIEALMMVRALFVRKRQPKGERVERFSEVLDFYLSHPNRVKQLHQSLFPDTVFVPKTSCQANELVLY